MRMRTDKSFDKSSVLASFALANPAIIGYNNTEHGTRNTEHGTRNTEHGTRNTEHGTRNTNCPLFLSLKGIFLFS
ncbi:MAG: hypothetical protein LBO82_07340, partial [Synergistaceae bacterium]|nr:hypothetical protein [Synergistaceae bacterium]